MDTIRLAGRLTLVLVVGTSCSDQAPGPIGPQGDTGPQGPSGLPASEGFARGWANVMDFGADPDDEEDDTEAILAAVATLPGNGTVGEEGYIHKPPTVLYFPLPTTNAGAYRVSATIDLSEKWNVAVRAPAPYVLNRGEGEERAALVKWHGAEGGIVFLFNYSSGISLENISVDCRDIPGTVGFSLGLPGAPNSSAKFVTATHVDASHCDVGIRIGDFPNNGPDVASLVFTNSLVWFNRSHGVSVNSGNGVAQFVGLTALLNGFDPSPGLLGANVVLNGGELTMSGYIGAGLPPYQPTEADIRMTAGGLKINGAWIETQGPAIVSDNANMAAYVAGLKHTQSDMSIANTPTSIRWQGPQPLVLSGAWLYGDVELASGNSAHVVDLGTLFERPGATFKGEQIEAQHGYVGLGGHDGHNEARVAIGRPPRGDGGDFKPFTLWSQNLRTGLVRSTADDFVVNELLNSGDSSYYLLHNAYYHYDDVDPAKSTFRSVRAGPVGMLRVAGGASPALSLSYGADAPAADSDVSLTSNAFSAERVPAGAPGDIMVVRVGNQTMGWAAGAPGTGSWHRGDVIFNANVAVGSPNGWRCVATGSPGTWVAMANL